MTDRAELRPGVHPREAFRAALKAKTLREAARTHRPAARSDAGTHDDLGGPIMHTVRTTDPYLGVTITAADLEPISEETAIRVARIAATIHDRNHHTSGN